MKDKKEIYLVPYSHLDTQWRWEYPTTILKYIKNTLDESIERFNKYPDHHFNFTGALRYGMMKEYFPKQFEEVKRLIDEERWHLAGTCLDETDSLVPSSESLIRNILYGDRWQKKEFGRSSKDYMIPDCFGFPGNMPTLMAHCGIIGFSSNKLTWGSAVGIPFEIGVWKGPDGSEIVSALNPCRYDSHMDLPVFMNPGRLGRLNRLGKKNGIWKSFQYYGVGDIGGAPKEGSVKRTLASIRHFNKKDGDLTVRQGGADQFFAEISDAEKTRMDRYEGDFLLTNHSAGTITSAAIMKRWNRKNEQMAFAAEAAALSAMHFAGAAYPSEKISSAWSRIIGSQMHDILPGTSTPIAYEYSHNDEVIALKTWSTVLEDSAAALAPYVKGDGKILLYNPHFESRRDPVHIELTGSINYENGMTNIMDAEGKKIPAVIQNIGDNKSRLTFIPILAPFGWSRYSLHAEEAPQEIDDSVALTETEDAYILENQLYKVTVTSSGKIESIYQKDRAVELFAKAPAYELQKERPMKFPAWNMDWRDRKKAPFVRIEEGGEVSIIERNPLHSTIQIVTKYGSSKLIKEISLSAGSEIVEFCERIEWRETGCSLKLAFTALEENPDFTCNWETSRVKRDVNHKKIFEVPSRLWADLSGKDGGFTIIEDSKYGYDRPESNSVRMTLLYTPALRYYNGFWDQKSHDWGEHTIRYGIHGHKGDWCGADSLARRFNQPVRSYHIGEKTKGGDLEDLSLFNVSDPQIGVLAVKKAEDDDSLIIRLYERYGREARGHISFASNLLGADEVNGIEEPMADGEFTGKQLSVNLPANGIRSYAVKLSEKAEKLQITQKALTLDFNKRMICKNNESGDALFPAEITPAKIASAGLSYNLEIEKAENALQCRGQKITVPANFSSISLLTGSEENMEIPFKWLDKNGGILKEELCIVSSMTDFAGQWDRRLWKREPKHFLKNRNDYAWLNKCVGIDPGYINRNRLEWYSTHTHKDGKDLAYRYGYLYSLKLAIPAEAKTLLLPDNKNAYIFAATVSDRGADLKSTQILTDKFDF
jgi:alpha-mannosidase